ncbi:MAG TPA: FUSC family protein [Stellaceae bacterium]|nr:FUSC family protein [Stellaceae bacterium]
MARTATSPASAPEAAGRLGQWAQSAGPALLFGLRMWLSVCLALYVAYWLELGNPFWAGTTAALTCQPQLGASLRKGWFRLIGTVVGAVAAVVLTACFPQSRVGFLVGLALWAAICGLVATLLHNFATYAAALAGFTTAIIAGDELGLIGGANGQAFTLALERATEISIGIVCAGVVLAGTDFGTARRRLAAQFASLAAEITGRLATTLRLGGPQQEQTREVRRDLIRRVIALDPVIDQAIGESSSLRYRSRLLQDALDGLFAALAAWRTAAYHLERLSTEEGCADGELVLRRVPAALRAAPTGGAAPAWVAAPGRIGQICEAAIDGLVELPAATPSLRLLADRIAEALRGISRALDGVALLAADPLHAAARNRTARLRVPDWLPALVNAARAFVTIGAAALFWIVTAWPGGGSLLTFAAIAILLFAPRADQAYAAASSFMLGVLAATAAAAVINFAVLPDIDTFFGFAAILGLYLVPFGALLALLPGQVAIFTAMTGLFVAILAPQNPNIYDTQQFYNSTLAIVAGLATAMIAFRLLPPLSPAYRTRRLLALALRDLRRLALDPGRVTREDWESCIYCRLEVLPQAATSEDRARMVAALAVGTEIIGLQHFCAAAGLGLVLGRGLAAIAAGDSAAAISQLGGIDHRLAVQPGDPMARMRARAAILAMSEALAQYRAYFDAPAPR